MSTIYRDKKTGSYFLNLRVGGVRRRISLKTRDRQVARMRAKFRERDLLGISAAGPVSLKAFTTDYLAWASEMKSPNTVKGERLTLERLERELPAGKRVNRISAHDADDVIAKIAGSGAAPARVNYYIRTFRAIFAVAVRWGYVSENPFASIRQMRVELEPPRVLSSVEIKAILRETAKSAPEFLDLWNFYLFTGFRRNEALSLSWERVDFERGFVTATGTKAKRQRVVPMLGPVRLILERRREFRRPFDFPPRSVSDQFIRMARAAGVQNASLHDMRRAFASYCTEFGVPKAWVQKWLGHVSWATSDEYYVGISDEMLKKLRAFETMIGVN